MQTAITVSSLPVSILRQHLFCPRIPFFNEYRGLNPGDRVWQRQGVDYQQRQQMLAKRRKLVRFGLADGQVRYQQQLASVTLGLHGICDAVIETRDGFYPLEFKLSTSRLAKGHRLQLAAYALLLEQQHNTTVEEGFILFGDRGATCRVTMDKWRQQVFRALAEVHRNLESPLLPNTSANRAQCGQCEYLNFCADRF